MITHKKEIPSFIYSILLVLIVFSVFSPALKGEILNWDDSHLIVENPFITPLNMETVKNIFFNIRARAYHLGYIPVTILTFSVEKHFFGIDPFPYHLNNILLHILVVLLIFKFVKMLGLQTRIAFVAALLFGIHPMHVESVAWITERKDVLYALFYMITLIFYSLYLKKRGMQWYFFSILSGIISILAKPMAVSIPLILFLIDWLYQRKLSKFIFIDKILHFTYTIPIAYVTFNMFHRIPSDTPLKGILTWIWSLTFYITKFFLPITLIPFYTMPENPSFFNNIYLYAVILFTAYLAVFFIFRKNTWIRFAGLFYFLSIFFLLKHDQTPPVTVADRYMYLPSLGFCILISTQCFRWLDNQKTKSIMHQKWGIVFLSLLLFCLITKTFIQNSIWKTNVDFYTYVLKYNPNESILYCNRGKDYQDKGNWKQALSDYNKAIELNPSFYIAYNLRGTLFKESKKYDLAINDFSQAIKLSPSFFSAYNNRGKVFKKLGQYELALGDYTNSINISPYISGTYLLRGNVYFLTGKNDLALNDFLKSLELNKYDELVYNSTAVAYVKKGEIKKALQYYSTALEINPSLMIVYHNRGILYLNKKNYLLALDDYNQLITLDPQNAFAYYQRSVIYKNLGQYSKALQSARKAQTLGNNEATVLIQELKMLKKTKAPKA